jgi:hypothetical protein
MAPEATDFLGDHRLGNVAICRSPREPGSAIGAPGAIRDIPLPFRHRGQSGSESCRIGQRRRHVVAYSLRVAAKIRIRAGPAISVASSS